MTQNDYKRIAKIHIAERNVEQICKYADEHPEEYFDFTEVYVNGKFYAMVSNLEPDDTFAECEELGLNEWESVGDGWERLKNGWAQWSPELRKNGKYMYITF